jgi:CPA1 family monovalent cation:H+ antiporter
LDEVAGEEWLTADYVDRLRVHYVAGSYNASQVPVPWTRTVLLEAAETFRRLRHETLSAERFALIGLRNDGTISDELLHRLEHELDVEALRLGIGERRYRDEVAGISASSNGRC